MTADRTIDRLYEELLFGYAAGTLPRPARLVVETHLYLAPGAARTLHRYECLGGALLDSMAPASLSAGMLDQIFGRIDDAPSPPPEPRATAAAARPPASPLAQFLTEELHRRECALRPCRTTRGLSLARLAAAQCLAELEDSLLRADAALLLDGQIGEDAPLRPGALFAPEDEPRPAQRSSVLLFISL